MDRPRLAEFMSGSTGSSEARRGPGDVGRGRMSLHLPVPASTMLPAHSDAGRTQSGACVTEQRCMLGRRGTKTDQIDLATKFDRSCRTDGSCHPRRRPVCETQPARSPARVAGLATRPTRRRTGSEGALLHARPRGPHGRPMVRRGHPCRPAARRSDDAKRPTASPPRSSPTPWPARANKIALRWSAPDSTTTTAGATDRFSGSPGIGVGRGEQDLGRNRAWVLVETG